MCFSFFVVTTFTRFWGIELSARSHTRKYHWRMGWAHWDRDKMADISQTTYSVHFHEEEHMKFDINISLIFVPKGQINNIPALVWRQRFSKPMLVSTPTHIWVNRPQWLISTNRGKTQYGNENQYQKDFHCIGISLKGPIGNIGALV